MAPFLKEKLILPIWYGAFWLVWELVFFHVGSMNMQMTGFNIGIVMLTDPIVYTDNIEEQLCSECFWWQTPFPVGQLVFCPLLNLTDLSI